MYTVQVSHEGKVLITKQHWTDNCKAAKGFQIIGALEEMKWAVSLAVGIVAIHREFVKGSDKEFRKEFWKDVTIKED